jgi:hypothetical protein
MLWVLTLRTRSLSFPVGEFEMRVAGHYLHGLELQRGEPQACKKVSCYYITTLIKRVTRCWDAAPACLGGKRSMKCQKLEVILVRAHENCIHDGCPQDLKCSQKQHKARLSMCMYKQRVHHILSQVM